MKIKEDRLQTYILGKSDKKSFINIEKIKLIFIFILLKLLVK